MYCSYCGKKLPDGAKFCSGCGKSLLSQAQNKNYTSKTKKCLREYLEQANNIAEFLIPNRLKALFPNAMPIAVVSSYLVVFIITVSVIGMWIGGGHDLSGTYYTSEYFPIRQITFDKSGHFSAAYYEGNYLETYEGKYQKQRKGRYECYFTGGISSSGNPVMKFDAKNMDAQCELAVNKVDENILEVQIVPKISYWAWNGKTVYFYK